MAKRSRKLWIVLASVVVLILVVVLVLPRFIDVNRYSQVTGGYWPVSWKVNGTTINQVSTGWPFTSVNPLGATSNTSGLYTWDGNPQTAYHTGPYVNVVDSCTGAPGKEERWSADGGAWHSWRRCFRSCWRRLRPWPSPITPVHSIPRSPRWVRCWSSFS